MNLESLRKRIDDIDARIVKLVGERIDIAGEIGRKKSRAGKQIKDREREDMVFGRIRSIAQEDGICQEDIESIYRRIVTACKRVQGAQVAFQGEVGAYSEEAAFQVFGTSIEIRPRETLEEVFKSVEE